jgi:hypothetical protein
MLLLLPPDLLECCLFFARLPNVVRVRRTCVELASETLESLIPEAPQGSAPHFGRDAAQTFPWGPPHISAGICLIHTHEFNTKKLIWCKVLNICAAPLATPFFLMIWNKAKG